MFAKSDESTLSQRTQNPGTLIVLDRKYRVIGTRGSDEDIAMSDGLRKAVREIASSWDASNAEDGRDAMYVSENEIAWIFPLRGPNDYRIAVYIEPFRLRATPVELADALGLVPTEYECVRLFAAGLTFDQISEELSIPCERVSQIFADLQQRFNLKSPMAVLALLSGHKHLVGQTT
ncbi:MAG: helix-turn-helix transcriptional regulator [Vulcanimicrobiaceae bacterium]